MQTAKVSQYGKEKLKTLPLSVLLVCYYQSSRVQRDARDLSGLLMHPVGLLACVTPDE